MQRREERMACGKRQYPLLRHCAVDVVILEDCVLLQHLDGVNLVGAFAFGQHDLAEGALAQDFNKVEVEERQLVGDRSGILRPACASFLHVGRGAASRECIKRACVVATALTHRYIIARIIGRLIGVLRPTWWRRLVHRDAHLVQHLSQLLRVDAAIVGDILLASTMDVHAAHFAL